MACTLASTLARTSSTSDSSLRRTREPVKGRAVASAFGALRSAPACAGLSIDATARAEAHRRAAIVERVAELQVRLNNDGAALEPLKAQRFAVQIERDNAREATAGLLGQAEQSRGDACGPIASSSSH